MSIPIDGSLVLLGEEHSGRDEMNLAGNPFALLQAASKTGQSLIKNEWERTLPNGRIVTAKWEVNGHTELGLPGPNEEMLFLVLLKLTREAADEQGVWPMRVLFSRYDVMRRMGWDNSARHYREITECFVRLNSVAINTQYAFWNAKQKTPYPAIGFGIIEDYSLVDEPKGKKSIGTLPQSWFKWNEILHQSFLAGNVRSLALDFVLSLELPTSRRLFRFLDMMRGSVAPYRREFAIGLSKLAERLGMRSYRYSSQTKQVLSPAIEELKRRNYLEDVRFEKSKDGVELAFFAFASVGQGSAASPTVKTAATKGKRPTAVQLTLDDSMDEKSGSADVAITDVRADAIRCHALFQSLKPAEQEELLTLAKAEVSPIWHDRVGQPESPMSLGLWQLVAQRYSEKLK